MLFEEPRSERPFSYSRVTPTFVVALLLRYNTLRYNTHPHMCTKHYVQINICIFYKTSQVVLNVSLHGRRIQHVLLLSRNKHGWIQFRCTTAQYAIPGIYLSPNAEIYGLRFFAGACFHVSQCEHDNCRWDRRPEQPLVCWYTNATDPYRTDCCSILPPPRQLSYQEGYLLLSPSAFSTKWFCCV